MSLSMDAEPSWLPLSPKQLDTAEAQQQTEAEQRQPADWQHDEERMEEVRQVREARMAQLQQRRQLNAAVDGPMQPRTPQQSNYDMEALSDLLVLLDSVVAVEQQQQQQQEEESPIDCTSGEVQDEGMDSEGERGVVLEVDEVVVVVAGDGWGRSVLIELHRQIYHADDSPCSHFVPQHEQPQQHQQLNEPMDAQYAALTMDAEAQQPSSSLSLLERAILAVLLLSAVVLLSATVAIACVIRHKQRQQRVLIEPPTIEQLGLDVPMLSSSPTTSRGQLLQL